ncbi:hypothetical protein JCM11641_008386 [Rhodosporidiobolus odoratus]
MDHICVLASQMPSATPPSSLLDASDTLSPRARPTSSTPVNTPASSKLPSSALLQANKLPTGPSASWGAAELADAAATAGDNMLNATSDSEAAFDNDKPPRRFHDFIPDPKTCNSTIELRDCLQALVPEEDADCIAVYRGACSKATRTGVPEGFKNGNIRIVIATGAFGIGCNVSGIQNVIKFGMPDPLVSLLQHWGSRQT